MLAVQTRGFSTTIVSLVFPIASLLINTGCSKGSAAKGGDTPPPQQDAGSSNSEQQQENTPVTDARAEAPTESAPASNGTSANVPRQPANTPSSALPIRDDQVTTDTVAATAGPTNEHVEGTTVGDHNNGGVGPECEASWKEKVETLKVGMVTAYEITTVVEGGLVITGERKRYQRDAIQHIQGDVVTIERTARSLDTQEEAVETHLITLTKADHVAEVCLGGDAGVGGAPEVLEDRTETLTTRAGSFDTHYLKEIRTGEEDGDQYEAVIEIWRIAGPARIEAKSISTITTTWNDKPRKDIVMKELVELAVP